MTASSVSQRIAEGESPQILLAELVTMNRTGGFTLSDLFHPLRVLVKNGARVATGQKGCAFELFIRDVSTGQALVFSEVLNDLLATPDEIPLHMIAGYSPVNLFVPLSMDVSPEIAAGLHKRDAQGRTVSHWLWAPDGVLVQQAARSRAAEGGDEDTEGALAKRWFATLQAVWKTQALLEGQGIRMDIPDNDGVTAMDLCLARIKAEDAILLHSQAICQRVQAYRDGAAMAAETPVVVDLPPPASPRF